MRVMFPLQSLDKKMPPFLLQLHKLSTLCFLGIHFNLDWILVGCRRGIASLLPGWRAQVQPIGADRDA